jgi:hypothetical protein
MNVIRHDYKGFYIIGTLEFVIDYKVNQQITGYLFFENGSSFFCYGGDKIEMVFFIIMFWSHCLPP